MRVIFAGTPEFAVSALKELHKAHEIVAVLTQPDSQSGRGMQMRATPVKKYSEEQSLKVLQPRTLKDAGIQQEIKDLKPDVMVVAAYGLMVPKEVLNTPKYGCINIHASILPRWRGAAPIQRAILAGDHESGVTIMQMNEGLDTGDMLLVEKCRIEADETSQTLHDKLAVLGAKNIMKALSQAEKGELVPKRQDDQTTTYAPKISKEEARIDWHKTAEEIERTIRAYQPFPVAYTEYMGAQLKIHKGRRVTYERGEAGNVVKREKNSLVIACGEQAIEIEQIQKPGGKVLDISSYLASSPIALGDVLGK